MSHHDHAPDHDDTPSDVDHPAPAKFLDLAEAVIDKHREADDNRDPYDAAEHDLVEFIRKHRAVIDDVYLGLDNGSDYFDLGDALIVEQPDDNGEHRRIPLD